MTLGELKHRLILDMKSLNLPVEEVDLDLRPYSKTYYGNYFPTEDGNNIPRIWLYPYSNKNGDLLPYSDILETGIHEMCHHLQYTDPNFHRLKGVMHNPQFWKLYNHYINRAKKYSLLGGDNFAKVI